MTPFTNHNDRRSQPITRRCKDKYTAMLNFVCSVESGSLVKAAEVLGLSPSAMSVSITRLEQCLGVKLLKRTTRTMSVTEEGDTFYQLARQVVDLTQRAFEDDLFSSVEADETEG